jgi:hypothetical protein
MGARRRPIFESSPRTEGATPQMETMTDSTIDELCDLMQKGAFGIDEQGEIAINDRSSLAPEAKRILSRI